MSEGLSAERAGTSWNRAESVLQSAKAARPDCLDGLL